jgi:hypothetical protein
VPAPRLLLLHDAAAWALETARAEGWATVGMRDD